MSPESTAFLKEELQGVKLLNPTAPLQGAQHSHSPRDCLASLPSLQEPVHELCLDSSLLGCKINYCDLSSILPARTAHVSCREMNQGSQKGTLLLLAAIWVQA